MDVAGCPNVRTVRRRLIVATGGVGLAYQSLKNAEDLWASPLDVAEGSSEMVEGARTGNFDRALDGYYREYVHPTPGSRGVGPQRVVVGQSGEIYYTPDHYKSFIRLR